MGTACSICQHPEREALDHALVSGMPNRAVATHWHVGREAVRRHARNHISPALAAVRAEREHEGAATLLDRVENLIARTETILEAAEQDGKVSAALAAVREMRGLLELLGKVSGELDTRPQVTINLMASEEYIAVRSAIFAALIQYPEARTAVASNLLQLEAGPS